SASPTRYCTSPMVDAYRSTRPHPAARTTTRFNCFPCSPPNRPNRPNRPNPADRIHTPLTGGPMPLLRQIRADFDGSTIVMYQAFAPAIADAAMTAGRFVAPFSFTRMTWIKPSLLWLMHRSNWAGKPGQERILAVRLTRAGWEQALSQAV